MSHTPLPPALAWRCVARCTVASAGMLVRHQVHEPDANVGRVLHFADGTASRVYRETATGRRPTEPCFLAVCFRLSLIRGRAHALFRYESILNTPLFIGFPGFVSKLWLTHDAIGRYRGIYEWDHPAAAEHYARALWRVLQVVSVPGSIDYQVVPGIRRDDAVTDPPLLALRSAGGGQPWWRIVP